VIKSSGQGNKPRAGDATRRRIVDAALETLRAEGYSGTTARAIAARGAFNPALIFYHFGGVDEVLLAGLDRSSEERLERWKSALENVDTASALVDTMRRLYDEDRHAAHITVVQELLNTSAFSAELGPELMRRMQPWVDFANQVIARVLGESPLRRAVDTRDLAFALIALYLGSEQVSRLQGDSSRIDSLFAAARRAAPMVDEMLGRPAPKRRSGRRATTRVQIED
jgi:AcrR family transcriptional regulator